MHILRSGCKIFRYPRSPDKNGLVPGTMLSPFDINEVRGFRHALHQNFHAPRVLHPPSEGVISNAEGMRLTQSRRRTAGGFSPKILRPVLLQPSRFARNQGAPQRTHAKRPSKEGGFSYPPLNHCGPPGPHSCSPQTTQTTQTTATTCSLPTSQSHSPLHPAHTAACPAATDCRNA